MGLTFDWPKLRHEELCVGRGTGGGGRAGRGQKRERREKQIEGRPAR